MLNETKQKKHFAQNQWKRLKTKDTSILSQVENYKFKMDIIRYYLLASTIALKLYTKNFKYVAVPKNKKQKTKNAPFI